MPFQTRPYQDAAVDAALDRLVARGQDGAMVVLATGTGKTVVAAKAAGRFPERLGRRVLYAANRVALVEQAYNAFCAEFGSAEVEVEMGQQRATGCADPDAPRFVIASKDSVCQPDRLARFDPDNFGLLISDEAHHWAPVCLSYVSVVRHFRRAKRLGLTATPNRTDGVGLAPYFGEAPAYVYGLGPACDDGWLVRPRQELVTVTGYDLSKVHVRDGDFTDEALGEVLSDERLLAAFADPTVRIANQGGRRRQVLAFTPTVKVAQRLADIINRPGNCPGRAVALWGEHPHDVRRVELARFRRGEYQFLVGCGLFLEGFDEPNIDMLAMARSTNSASFYEQMIGRGTRPHSSVARSLGALATPNERQAHIAASPKPDLLVADFMGNAGRHKVMTCVDLLGSAEAEEVRERAKSKIREEGGADMGVREALAAALAEVEGEERARRRHILIRTEFSRREVDLFDPHDTAPAVAAAPVRLYKPASEKQKAVLRKFGNFTNEDRLAKMSARQAAGVIQGLIKSGKWTPRG